MQGDPSETVDICHSSEFSAFYSNTVTNSVSTAILTLFLTVLVTIIICNVAGSCKLAIVNDVTCLCFVVVEDAHKVLVCCSRKKS